jgi:hypothetical protein
MDDHAWRAISSVIADIMGPTRLLLSGDHLDRLLPPLLSLHMRTSLVCSIEESVKLEEAHPGVIAYSSVKEAMQYQLPDALVASSDALEPHVGLVPDDTGEIDSLVLILRADASAMHVAELSNDLLGRGWSLHPRQYVAEAQHEILSFAGAQLFALARRGVDAATPSRRMTAGRRQLAVENVRPGDRVLVVADEPREIAIMLAATAQAAETVFVVDATSIGLQDPARQFDFILWEPVAARAVDDVALAELASGLAPGGRLALIGHVPVDKADDIIRRMEMHTLSVENLWEQDRSSRPVRVQILESGRADLRLLQSGTQAEHGIELLVLVRTRARYRHQPSGEAARDGGSPPNILAIFRDYDDPGIFRLIVAIGLRIESKAVRRSLAHQYLLGAAPSSADYGAALCVLCYDWLDEGSAAEADVLLERSRVYLSGDAVNPTAFRWKVSVAFVNALIHERLGHMEDAAQCYRQVASLDVLQFSPLLGTKTIASLLALSWQAYGNGDTAAARGHWKEVLIQAKRLANFDDWSEVIGSFHAPETFGMPELSAILDEAGRAAAALRASEADAGYRGKVWKAAGWSRQAMLGRALLDLQGVREWAGRLDGGRRWLSEQYEALLVALSDAESSARKREDSMAALREAKEWLDTQYRSLSGQLDLLSSANRDLQKSKAWLESQLASHVGECARLAEMLESRANHVSSLEDGKRWLEAQYESLCAQLDVESAINHDLWESKTWLESQVGSHAQESARLGRMLESAEQAVSALEEAKQWLVGQLESHQLEISRLRAEERSAREYAAERLEAATRSLELERARLSALESSRWFRFGKLLGIFGGKDYDGS